MPEVLLKPVPHREAAAFIREKPAVARAVFDALLPELQARAFVVTGIENLNILEALRERIGALPEGGDWEAVKQDLVAELSPWLGGEPAARRRAEILLRWHGFQAYSAAQYQVMDRQRDVFPWWRYDSAEDGRVRPSHAALDGKILPADHPFWATHFPPWEWGCRCRVVPLSQAEVEAIEAREAGLPPEARRVVPEALLRELESGTLVTARRIPGPGTGRFEPPERIDVRTPREKGRPGPAWRPGDVRLRAGDIRARYSPESWRVFEAWARRQRLPDGRSVWAWMGGEAPGPAEAPASAGLSAAALRRERIARARYTRRQPLGGGVNTTVILTNGEKVVFKPAGGEANDVLRPGMAPNSQYKREAAASIIDEALGTHLVPPTTIITYRGETGSAQLFQEGFVVAYQAVREGVLPSHPAAALARFTKRQRQDWQLLDEILAHTDRHAGNWMVRPHADDAGLDLALIDNGLCLSDTGFELYRILPAAGEALDAVSRRRLERFLQNEARLREALADLLEPGALDAMFGRARRLLARGAFASA